MISANDSYFIICQNRIIICNGYTTAPSNLLWMKGYEFSGNAQYGSEHSCFNQMIR